MAKRRTKRADQRAKRKSDKEAGMNKPSGKSRYGKKNRPKEIARGYSTRPTSPFYLSPDEVKRLRALQPSTPAATEAEAEAAA